MNDSLGKTAERKIKEWLDKPEKGYSFDRIPDQMNGFYQSCNICDFTLFKSPYMYYIESKATYKDRFDFNMITNYQKKHLFEKSKIDHVYGCIVILFADYKRAFVINIQHIIRYQIVYFLKAQVLLTGRMIILTICPHQILQYL